MNQWHLYFSKSIKGADLAAVSELNGKEVSAFLRRRKRNANIATYSFLSSVDVELASHVLTSLLTGETLNNTTCRNWPDYSRPTSRNSNYSSFGTDRGYAYPSPGIFHVGARPLLKIALRYVRGSSSTYSSLPSKSCAHDPDEGSCVADA